MNTRRAVAFANLLTLLRTKGAYIAEGLQLEETKGKGASLVTHRPINKGEVIIRLTPECILDPKKAILPDHPYIEALPDEYYEGWKGGPVPNHILVRLCDGDLKDLPRLRDEVKEHCEFAAETISAALEIYKGHTDDTAFLTALTRAFDNGFYPLIDMCNHDWRPTCFVSDHQLKASRDIPAGTELTIIYKMTSFYDLVLLMDIPILAENFLAYNLALPDDLEDRKRRFLADRALASEKAKAVRITFSERGPSNATMAIFRILHFTNHKRLDPALGTLINEGRLIKDLISLCRRTLPTETTVCDDRLKIIFDIREKIKEILNNSISVLEGEWLKFVR